MHAIPWPLSLLLVAATGAAWGETHVVTVQGMVFKPALITVKAGDTITWENRDVVPHTVTAKGVFDSRALSPGARWSWQATGKGRTDYICNFHPGMAGSVVVQ